MHSLRIDTAYEPDSTADSESESEFLAGDDDLVVNLIVGGCYFSLTVGEIRSHPNCYFARAIKEPWKNNGEHSIVINRDGALFKHVHLYLCGWKKDFSKRPVEWILALKQEADFYNLESLVKHCDIHVTHQIMEMCWSSKQVQEMLQPVSTLDMQTQSLVEQILPSYFRSTLDVSTISDEFVASITSNSMSLASITWDWMHDDIFMDGCCPILSGSTNKDY